MDHIEAALPDENALAAKGKPSAATSAAARRPRRSDAATTRCGRTAHNQPLLYRPARLRVKRHSRAHDTDDRGNATVTLARRRAGACLGLIARDHVFAGFDARLPVSSPASR
jgi:hypothetical protein